MKFTLLIAFLFVFSTAVVVAEDQQEPTDTRLDQKVTYQAKGELMHKVIEDLANKTGVYMECGTSSKDWQVRDRKITIFVKDMPLKDLQQSIADLMNFTWARGAKEGVYTYRIFQDLKSKKEEENMRTRDKEEKVKKLQAKRKAALETIDKISSLSPEEIEKLKTEEPFSYFLAKEPIGKSMAQMIQSVPEIRNALAEGTEFTLDLAQAPPVVADAAKTFMKSYYDIEKRMMPPDADYHRQTPEIPDSMQNYQIVINSGLENYSDAPMSPMGEAFLGIISIQSSASMDVDVEEVEVDFDSEDTYFGSADMPLFDPNSRFAKMVGEALIKVSEGMPPDMVDESFGEQSMIEMMNAEEEKPEPLPDDPALEKTVKLEQPKQDIQETPDMPDPSDIQDMPGMPDMLELPALIEQFAKQSDFQYISDHFTGLSDMYAFMMAGEQMKKEDKLGSLLQSTATIFGKRIKLADKLITFKDKIWYEKRAWEIPQASLERWREGCKNDTLTINDFIDMACLTDGQIDNTLTYDESLSSISWELKFNRNILRLYSTLTAAQKKALQAPEGLAPSMLTANQWPYFEQLIESDENYGIDEDISELLKSGADMALMLEVNPEFTEYVFTLENRSAVPDPETGEVDTFAGYWSIDISTNYDEYEDYEDFEFDPDSYDSETYDEDAPMPGSYEDDAGSN